MFPSKLIAWSKTYKVHTLNYITVHIINWYGLENFKIIFVTQENRILL